MNHALEICYTKPFHSDALVAIDWKSKTVGTEAARDSIKSLIRDFDNQVRLFPDSGKSIDIAPIGERYSELIKGDYRFVFKTEADINGKKSIYVLMFCHQRMNFETLMRQRHITTLIR